MSTLHNVRVSLEMIKWEHSVFALPFAFCGAMLAAGGLPSPRQLLWIMVAMVSARSAAMAFNRYVDAEIDAANPRTRSRALPAGILSKQFVGVFVIAGETIAELIHVALVAFDEPVERLALAREAGLDELGIGFVGDRHLTTGLLRRPR